MISCRCEYLNREHRMLKATSYQLGHNLCPMELKICSRKKAWIQNDTKFRECNIDNCSQIKTSHGFELSFSIISLLINTRMYKWERYNWRKEGEKQTDPVRIQDFSFQSAYLTGKPLWLRSLAETFQIRLRSIAMPEAQTWITTSTNVPGSNPCLKLGVSCIPWFAILSWDMCSVTTCFAVKCVFLELPVCTRVRGWKQSPLYSYAI